MAKRRKKKKKEFNLDLTVVVLIIISILLAVLIFTKSGYIGEQLSPMLGGLVGIIKYLIPIGTFAIAISLACQKQKYMTMKLGQYTVFLLCICVILCIFQISNEKLNVNDEFWTVVKEAYTLGEQNQGGGAIGAMIALPFIDLIGIYGTIILNAGVAIILLIIMFDIKPAQLIAEWIEEMQERRKEIKETEEKEIEEPVKKERKTKTTKIRNVKTEEPAIIEEIPMEEQITINIPENKLEKKNKNNGKKGNDFIESNLFKQEVEKKEEKTKEVLTLEHAITIEDEHYEFPPIEFLEIGEQQVLKGGKKSVTETAERKENKPTNNFQRERNTDRNTNRTNNMQQRNQNSNYNNRNNNNNRFNNRNNNGGYNNGYNRSNNRNNNSTDRFNKRPLDAKGIEKNIKNIMSVETVEKENVREYNRGLDKQKNNNKFNENKNTKKSKS